MSIDALKSLVSELREDGDGSVGAVGVLLRAQFTRPRKRLIAWIRLQEWLHSTGRGSLARMVSSRIYTKYHCVISPSARIGKRVLFAHPVGVVIGDGVVVGDDCIIFQHVTLGKRSLGAGGYPRIGDRVVLFSGSQILGAISIASDVKVGALSIVTESCSVAGATLVGIPARPAHRSEAGN